MAKGKGKQLSAAERDRVQRLKWFHQARFGMFIHWGLYSQLGRHEWVMNRERIPVAEYEKLAVSFKPKSRPARAWAQLARQAGMKYMVMTTKHHEGFCLWDTRMTDYNAVKCGPGRDLVAEFVDACREFGLRIGFYYSLMDWHHPDGARCAKSEPARKRFVEFTHGCVRELCGNYGKIDIMWYDVHWPLSADGWESRKMNRMVRRLQPDIIINNRSGLPEDFGTPEQHVRAEPQGRAWEACMTMNQSWGYTPIDRDWKSARDCVKLLGAAASGGGNLLLNIGPAPDGSIPPESRDVLTQVGQWVKRNGEAIYGTDRVHMEWQITGYWTAKGNIAYFHSHNWPGSELVIGGLKSKVLRAELLATGRRLRFKQSGPRLILSGLPAKPPDPLVTVIKLPLRGKPRQALGPGCVVL